MILPTPTVLVGPEWRVGTSGGPLSRSTESISGFGTEVTIYNGLIHCHKYIRASPTAATQAVIQDCSLDITPSALADQGRKTRNGIPAATFYTTYVASASSASAVHGSSRLSTGVIVGISVGSLAGVIGGILVLWFAISRSSRSDLRRKLFRKGSRRVDDEDEGLDILLHDKDSRHSLDSIEIDKS